MNKPTKAEYSNFWLAGWAAHLPFYRLAPCLTVVNFFRRKCWQSRYLAGVYSLKQVMPTKQRDKITAVSINWLGSASQQGYGWFITLNMSDALEIWIDNQDYCIFPRVTTKEFPRKTIIQYSRKKFPSPAKRYSIGQIIYVLPTQVESHRRHLLIKTSLSFRSKMMKWVTKRSRIVKDRLKVYHWEE